MEVVAFEKFLCKEAKMITSVTSIIIVFEMSQFFTIVTIFLSGRRRLSKLCECPRDIIWCSLYNDQSHGKYGCCLQIFLLELIYE